MSTGYDDIKLFYENILKKESICKNINVPITDFADYVMSVYDEIDNEKYSMYRQSVPEILGIHPNKIKEMILDAIYSNLYCDAILVLQNLCENTFGIRHEVFITSIEYNDELGAEISQSCRERFRRRMQPNRLNLIKKFKMNSSDEECFYLPTLVRAFKETMLIRRPGTEILDISQNYADIFMFLMFDTDEDNEKAEVKKSKETIKSYLLWKLADNDTKHILDLYKVVFNSPLKGDKFVQLMLLEKLFGIYTIAKVLSIGKKGLNIIEEFAPLHRLGYCVLNNFLIDKRAKVDNLQEIIYEYIYPFCVDVLSEVMKAIFLVLEELDDDCRAEYVKSILSICSKYTKGKFVEDEIVWLSTHNISELTDAIKIMMGVNKVSSFRSMQRYISYSYPKRYTSRFYDSKYKNEIVSNRLCEKSYIDLLCCIKRPSAIEKIRKILFPYLKKQ